MTRWRIASAKSKNGIKPRISPRPRSSGVRSENSGISTPATRGKGLVLSVAVTILVSSGIARACRYQDGLEVCRFLLATAVALELNRHVTDIELLLQQL